MNTNDKHKWNPNLSRNRLDKTSPIEINNITKGLLQGDIKILSKAITLIESSRSEDKLIAQQLIENIMPYTGSSLRIAITGAPGVGKSTFLESIGNHITDQDHKIAVLSIDPSSSLSRGSILGDKTRMSTLSNNLNAFIRPTAAGETLGGIGSMTRETILLCEAAGFDTIFIETVGVGQSETEIFHMADIFVLLIEPGAGDELQGIKRGIMELADIIFVTKADVSDKLTNQSLSAYRQAIHILQAKAHTYPVNVYPHDSLSGQYAAKNWAAITDFKDKIEANNYLAANRSNQNIYWFEKIVKDTLITNILNQSNTKELVLNLKEKISKQEITVPHATNIIFNAFKSMNFND